MHARQALFLFLADSFSECFYSWARNEVSELLRWSAVQLPLWMHRQAFKGKDSNGIYTEHML